MKSFRTALYGFGCEERHFIAEVDRDATYSFKDLNYFNVLDMLKAKACKVSNRIIADRSTELSTTMNVNEQRVGGTGCMDFCITCILA